MIGVGVGGYKEVDLYLLNGYEERQLVSVDGGEEEEHGHEEGLH